MASGTVNDILIFGATQGTGYQVLLQALEAGYKVFTLARTPSKLQVEMDAHADNLHVIQGDVCSEENVSQVFSLISADAIVVSSLGFTKGAPKDMLSVGIRNITACMKKHLGPNGRLIVVSSANIRDPSLPFFFRWVIYPLFLKRVMLELEAMEEFLMDKSPKGGDALVAWTIIRPPGLTNGDLTKTYRISDTNLPQGGGRISRADLAHFIMNEFAAKSCLADPVGFGGGLPSTFHRANPKICIADPVGFGEGTNGYWFRRFIG